MCQICEFEIYHFYTFGDGDGDELQVFKSSFLIKSKVINEV